MNNELIQLALKLLNCNQKELAQMLDVSPSQVTKWKKGEHMSWEMKEKIEDMLELDGLNPMVVLLSGSISNARKWLGLIYYLADLANEESETGYNTLYFTEELEMLGWRTFDTLKEMGVTLPPKFPSELEIIYKDIDSDTYCEKAYETVTSNPYSSLIYDIYLSLNDVYGFYVAYIYEMLWKEKFDLLDSITCNIEDNLMDLAASKIDTDKDYMSIVSNFLEFRYKTNKNYEAWLMALKEIALQHNVPLKSELLNLVYQDSGVLGHHAEREALGFNKGNLHPDIYMNELLTGMRIIHQVLPAILKKLDLYDEFYLDDGKLRLK